MAKKMLTCLVCPRSCRMEAQTLSLAENAYKITGHQCARGETYAAQELANPTRTLTTTVKISNAVAARLPVRTAAPIPRQLMPQCLKLLKGLEMEAPVHMGGTVTRDILGTGVDVIASRSIKLCKGTLVSEKRLAQADKTGVKDIGDVKNEGLNGPRLVVCDLGEENWLKVDHDLILVNWRFMLKVERNRQG